MFKKELNLIGTIRCRISSGFLAFPLWLFSFWRQQEGLPLLTNIASAGVIVISTGSVTLADAPSNKDASQNTLASVVSRQRAQLNRAALLEMSGPQSPRDITNPEGSNRTVFGNAPNRRLMNLCNIHFHDGAEHRGSEFNRYAGNTDGSGYESGYLYSGQLTRDELKPLAMNRGSDGHRTLQPGSTIEIHYVYTTANVKPGSTLASCHSPEHRNPQLRVEAVIAVLVNNRRAANFSTITRLSKGNGYHSAPSLPDNLGTPVVYSGSTTGPSYNTRPSPYQVTWSVRPKVLKVDALSVDEWLRSNQFKEDHAHGVRNLIINPALLSRIQPVN